MSDISSNGESTTESRGRRLNLSLSSLYLDPNNFRFIDHKDYRPVDESEVTNEKIQRRTLRLLAGRDAEQVADLVASFTHNGWLDVEPIQVRKLGEDRYLVLEGNRRVAALKHMQSRWQDEAADLGELDPAVFGAVPCVLYEETDEAHRLVVMGLHHISGKRNWPAISQASLMKRLRDDFKRDLDELCRSLGVSKRELNLSLGALALIDAYRRSDYGDQFSPEMFDLFREILTAPELRAWLGWDPETERATNILNLEKLFSWLSREPNRDNEDKGLGEGAAQSGEPVITTHGQIDDLAKVINDADAVKQLEQTRNLQAAMKIISDRMASKIADAVERSLKEKLFQVRYLLRQSEPDLVELALNKKFLYQVKHTLPPPRGSERPWPVYTDVPQAHFHSIHVSAYRAISGLELAELGRVNLLVGVNNAGKTSVLEVVYLLVHLVDPRAVLEVLRLRARLDPEAHPSWTVNQLPTEARLSGAFDTRDHNTVSLRLAAQDRPEDPDEDWATYLRTLVMEGSYAESTQRSVTDFFKGRTRQTRIEGEPRWLCPALLHSPFSLSDPETLTRCHEASIRAKSKERVLDFIRSHLDPGIQDIELADEHNRFLVTHARLPEAADLSCFGEGLQRVFQIGLLFAGARGGVVLIDEFENALHTNVLIDFTKFVQELAVEFNVQVFITTHSKETVDAFLLNDYRTDDVVAYLLKREDDGPVSALRFPGPLLKRAVEVGDVDLRRL